MAECCGGLAPLRWEGTLIFTSLHTHTTFSYQDALGTPAKHFERIAELGMTAVGITDHGNVSAHVQAMKASKKTGTKFIPGCEFYMDFDHKANRKFHITVLAMNQKGLENLYELVTLSWQNFHRWPTITPKGLLNLSEGLIVISGCSDSLLSCALLGGKLIEPWAASWERAESVAFRFREVLGDRYYLECQQFPELERTRVLNPAWEKMGAKLNIPLVATADVHMTHPGKGEVRALIHAAGRGSNTIAQQMSEWEYNVPDTYPTDDDDLIRRMEDTKLSRPAAVASVENTAIIAERGNVELPIAPLFEYQYEPGEEVWPENVS